MTEVASLKKDHESHEPNTALRDLEALHHVDVRLGVNLRLLQQQDAPRLIEILRSDPSIRNRVTVAARMKTEEDAHSEITKLESSENFVRYAIMDNEKMAGLLSLWRNELWRNEDMTGEVIPNVFGFGFFLDPEARGRGLVSSSIKSLMSVVQENLQVDSFIAWCEDDNLDSIAVLKSVGLEPTDVTHKEAENGWPERLYRKDVK